ncbi:MAG TPA: DUF6010 family protein [Acidimicrobiales bacterium]|nr:DUF6010 family protein [Acidimicrobiales bacterium]
MSTFSLGRTEQSTATEFHLSPVAGAAAGLGLAVVMLAPLLLVSKEAGLQFLAVQLGFIGAIYFGFGIADRRVAALLPEFLQAGAFLMAGTVALWAGSPAFLAAAYAAHAGWDLVHHPRGVRTRVERWYPPFCVVFDLVCVAFIVAWLPLHGIG